MMLYDLVCVFLITFVIVINPAVGQGYNRMGSYNGGSLQSQRIPIGLITDDDTEELRGTFFHAISTINAELTIPLVGVHEEIGYGHSMLGVKYLCKMMENGVGGVFGPSALTTTRHLMSVCDSKDIPYIFSHMSEADEGFNLHPHPSDMAKALHAVISAFEWRRYLFLYENAEYLSILNTLMSMYGTEGPIISVMRYDLSLNGNYKAVLRRVRKSLDNRVVVAGSTDSVEELLRQAQQVGIMNDEYNYIICNLDLQTFDLEEYKYSEANITGFRIYSAEQPEVLNLIRALDLVPPIYDQLGYDDDYEDDEEDDRDDNNADFNDHISKTEQAMIKSGSCPITTEMALLYDAVVAFAETTKYIQYVPQSLDCTLESTTVQEDGSTFKNYMRSLSIEKNTLSGGIYFDGPRRKGYTLDVIELQQSGLVKVGVWEENKNFTFERPPQPQEIPESDYKSMVNKTLLILISVQNLPYASLVDSPKKLHGNAMYEGYAVDLIKSLAEKLGFNYTLKDGGRYYGSFNKTTNVTTGLLKEIMEGDADLAVTDLTITSERQEVIDFTIPFMNTGIAILYLKPQKSEPTTFSFMDPFSKQVWQYLGLAFLTVSLCFFVLGRLSPTEWDHPYPCIENPEQLENQFTLNSSIWLTTGSFLQQGSDIAPKSLSTRTVAVFWCFFTLIVVSSYTANLASFLTVEKPTTVLSNVKDLADNKGGVQYGANRNGATKNFFATSDNELYKKMNDYMSANPDLLLDSNEAGVARVKNSDVKSGNTYAFLMESTSIEYHTVKECNLQKVGEPLDEKGYGIAMKKNWPYRDTLNFALLELQEQGVLAKIKQKWWNEMAAGACDSKSSSSTVNALSVNNLEGIYYVLIVGSALSLAYGIVCWCWHIGKKSRTYDVAFQAALWEELKSVAEITNNERPLKSAASVYSPSRNSSLDSIDSFDTDSGDEEGEGEEKDKDKDDKDDDDDAEEEK